MSTGATDCNYAIIHTCGLVQQTIARFNSEEEAKRYASYLITNQGYQSNLININVLDNQSSTTKSIQQATHASTKDRKDFYKEIDRELRNNLKRYSDRLAARGMAIDFKNLCSRIKERFGWEPKYQRIWRMFDPTNPTEINLGDLVAVASILGIPLNSLITVPVDYPPATELLKRHNDSIVNESNDKLNIDPKYTGTFTIFYFVPQKLSAGELHGRTEFEAQKVMHAILTINEHGIASLKETLPRGSNNTVLVEYAGYVTDIVKDEMFCLSMWKATANDGATVTVETGTEKKEVAEAHDAASKPQIERIPEVFFEFRHNKYTSTGMQYEVAAMMMPSREGYHRPVIQRAVLFSGDLNVEIESGRVSGAGGGFDREDFDGLVKAALVNTSGQSIVAESDFAEVEAECDFLTNVILPISKQVNCIVIDENLISSLPGNCTEHERARAILALRSKALNGTIHDLTSSGSHSDSPDNVISSLFRGHLYSSATTRKP